MKHFSLLVALFIFVSCFSACSDTTSSSSISSSVASVATDSSKSNETSQFTVGIIECPWVLNTSAVDAGFAEIQFAALDPNVSVISCFASNEKELLEFAAQLLEDNAQALIVSLPSSTAAQSLIELCKEKNISLIFTGAKPTPETMQSYNNCWYIEMLCEQTGELLGKAVAEDFKSGIIPDTNGDGLLQYAWFGGDNLGGTLHYEYSLQSAADMGVFSSEIFSQLTACGQQAGYAMAQNLLGISLISSDSSTSETSEIIDTAPIKYPTPEAVLCADSATARGAAPLLKEAGIYVACVGLSEQDAQALESEDIHAPTWFARDTVTNYAVLFANNLLNGKHVTLDTNLYLDEFRQTLVTAGGKSKS